MPSRQFYESYWQRRIADDHCYDDRLMPRHRLAADVLAAEAPERVLDVGCGEGTLGELLRDRGVDAELVGIDVSPTALDLAAEHYDRTVEWNLDERSVTEDAFDVDPDAVVCMEVLEHLWDPQATLTELRTLVPEDGRFVASVPNAVHWRYRLDYLRGRLPEAYTLYGGAEHVQDFTLATFEAAVRDAGFAIDRLNPRETVPVVGVHSRAYQRLFAEQFTIVAH